jgi:hypothetical protein
MALPPTDISPRRRFIWSAYKRSPKEFGGQGNGLSQKLASRKGLAAERMPTKTSLRNQRNQRQKNLCKSVKSVAN